MYGIIRKVLFSIEPEKVHYIVMRRLQWAYNMAPLRSMMKKMFVTTHPSLERKLWGITFPNPVGLAAGFDKDAKYTDALASLGFGFVEMATPEEAQKAIQELNGATIDGRAIMVSLARPQTDRPRTGGGGYGGRSNGGRSGGGRGGDSWN